MALTYVQRNRTPVVVGQFYSSLRNSLTRSGFHQDIPATLSAYNYAIVLEVGGG